MQDLERELWSDLEFEEEEQREKGLSPEEARYAAPRAFGNPTLIREQTHEAWGWATLERLCQHLFYTIRSTRRAPLLSFIAVVALSLGIGLNAGRPYAAECVVSKSADAERPAVSIRAARPGSMRPVDRN